MSIEADRVAFAKPMTIASARSGRSWLTHPPSDTFNYQALRIVVGVVHRQCRQSSGGGFDHATNRNPLVHLAEEEVRPRSLHQRIKGCLVLDVTEEGDTCGQAQPRRLVYSTPPHKGQLRRLLGLERLRAVSE